MSSPVAIVTGGASGIGLALVQHLVALGWKVVIADLKPPREPIPNTLFVPTDISSWAQQAAMFKQAYIWGKRLDFCALNAGTDDRDNDMFSALSHNVEKPPQEPNIRTFAVNLTGTYYGVKLAAHYMTLHPLASSKPKPGGKIVITSSGAGIVPLPAIPQYTASKHALVGLVRALGGNDGALKANVRINAVCPDFVNTPFLRPGLAEKLGPDVLTPMSRVMQCFDALGNLGNVGREDWVETGPTGETVEANVHRLVWHHPPIPKQGDPGSSDKQKLHVVIGKAYEQKGQKIMSRL